MKWLRRILLTLLAIVGVLTLALFVAGLRSGSDSMTSRVEVNKPRESVWKYFHDPVKTKTWVSWLVEIRNLTPGNEGVGAKEIWVMEDRNNNNERMEIANEITAIDPGHRVAFNLSVPGAFEGKTEYRFDDNGSGGTILTTKSSFRFENAFARFMTPVVLRFAEKKMAADLEHFKSNVEKE